MIFYVLAPLPWERGWGEVIRIKGFEVKLKDDISQLFLEFPKSFLLLSPLIKYSFLSKSVWFY